MSIFLVEQSWTPPNVWNAERSERECAERQKFELAASKTAKPGNHWALGFELPLKNTNDPANPAGESSYAGVLDIKSRGPQPHIGG